MATKKRVGLVGIQRRFDTEDACRDYLFRLRWPGGFIYPVFNADTDMLKWLHTIVSNTNAFVSGTFHCLGKKHLQSYLDEYCYRFTAEVREAVISDRLLLAVIQSAPLRFADLT